MNNSNYILYAIKKIKTLLSQMKFFFTYCKNFHNSKMKLFECDDHAQNSFYCIKHIKVSIYVII